jgi:hypothetical protein
MKNVSDRRLLENQNEYFMKNVSYKRLLENQNAYFMFNNSFLKIVPFMSQCEKNMVEPDRPELTMYNGTEKM